MWPPIARWRVPPPSPHGNWRILTSSPSPSIPTLPLLLPPCSLVFFSFLMLRKGVAQAGVGEVLGAPGIFSEVAPVQMRGVLRYKWEAYCATNGRCTAAFPFLQGFEARKAQRYTWGAYCGTNWRCTASTFQTSCTGWEFLKQCPLGRRGEEGEGSPNGTWGQTHI